MPSTRIAPAELEAGLECRQVAAEPAARIAQLPG
jgi:hypothetical protein